MAEHRFILCVCLSEDKKINEKLTLVGPSQKVIIFDKKKNRKQANIQPSLHFYGMMILVKTPVQRNGMAAIPKILSQFQQFYKIPIIHNSLTFLLTDFLSKPCPSFLLFQIISQFQFSFCSRAVLFMFFFLCRKTAQWVWFSNI